MPDTLYIQMHNRGKRMQFALLTAGILIFTVLIVVILFFGVLVTRVGSF